MVAALTEEVRRIEAEAQVIAAEAVAAAARMVVEAAMAMPGGDASTRALAEVREIAMIAEEETAAGAAAGQPDVDARAYAVIPSDGRLLGDEEAGPAVLTAVDAGSLLEAAATAADALAADSQATASPGRAAQSARARQRGAQKVAEAIRKIEITEALRTDEILTLIAARGAALQEAKAGKDEIAGVQAATQAAVEAANAMLTEGEPVMPERDNEQPGLSGSDSSEEDNEMGEGEHAHAGEAAEATHQDLPATTQIDKPSGTPIPTPLLSTSPTPLPTQPIAIPTPTPSLVMDALQADFAMTDATLPGFNAEADIMQMLAGLTIDIWNS